MSDNLEIFIDKHSQELDTIEPTKEIWSNIESRIDVKPLKAVKSKLLSKFIYFSLSSIFIVSTIIYFVLHGQKEKSPITPQQKPKETLEVEVIINNAPKKEITIEENENRHQTISTSFTSQNHTEAKEMESIPTLSENPILNKQDTLKLKVKEEKTLVDIDGVPRGIFYHIGYMGGPIAGKKSHILSWYTHKELPNTYFIIEHFIWNKWIQRGKVIAKSRPGRPQYSGEIIGKYAYHLKLPPHSGENKWRVLLMNDSNACIGVSKELDGVDAKGEPLHLSPKVSYKINNKDKEIIFNSQTYYELHDVAGKIVDKGMALYFFYGTVEPGVYTLYYDNSVESIKLK